MLASALTFVFERGLGKLVLAAVGVIGMLGLWSCDRAALREAAVKAERLRQEEAARETVKKADDVRREMRRAPYRPGAGGVRDPYARD